MIIDTDAVPTEFKMTKLPADRTTLLRCCAEYAELANDRSQPSAVRSEAALSYQKLAPIAFGGMLRTSSLVCDLP